jgi:hypothetical protein
LNFFACIPSRCVDLAIAVFVDVDPVTIIAVGIGLVTEVVAASVNAATGLDSKNCLETHLEGKLLAAQQK